MTDPLPEIARLWKQSWLPSFNRRRVVTLDDAERAVRDADARARRADRDGQRLYSAWRSWLASDEALERATAAIATVDEKMAHESGGIVVCAGEEQQARAVLTALRGDGDV